ncbi:MAG: hypothetical protein U5Q44_03420 [Dehalococcoidia bacterium]|nr:hypothetical protein [Dehalococcoidia bacterium]
MVQDTEVLEASMDIARDYVRRATEALETVPDGEARRSLQNIANYVLERDT